MRYLSFFGLLILPCFQLYALEARAESGYQVIQGTRVFTEIDHARGVATFSNSCGSQTLTQRQLQQGAIPSRIIPCNENSGSSNKPKCRSDEELSPDGGCMSEGSTYCGNGNYCKKGFMCIKGGCLDRLSSRVCTDLKTYCNLGYECRAGNECVSPKAEEARDHLTTGRRYYEEGKYREASEAFEKAAEGFKSADQPENASDARERQFQSLCRVAIERDKADADSLKEMIGEGHCGWSVEEISDLETAIDSIEKKKKGADSPPPAPSPKRKPSDSSSGVKDAAHCIDVFNIKGSTYKVSNSCTFGVNIKLETMNFSPKATETDSYYLSSGSNMMAISYHGFQPVVVSACGKGSVCR